KIVIIGVSTGGPSTLEVILPELPENYPAPVVVAQHMPAAFTKTFAKRLDSICRMSVVEVSKPQILHPGTIYIAKGGADIAITERSGKKMAVPKPESPKYLWHPSVELLGLTTLEVYEPENITAVLLTGMGNDGSDSFMEIKNKGGKTIAEAEETAVVFGMPKELIEKDGASLILPADKIGPQLRRLTL
ncbi:MAG: chemotaxis response regulator protein-glutamate methylesterase, partial [Spirochaetes bacterium]